MRASSLPFLKGLLLTLFEPLALLQDKSCKRAGGGGGVNHGVMITVSEQIDTQINLSAAARKLKAAVDVSSEAAERARSELTLKEGGNQEEASLSRALLTNSPSLN